MLFKSMIRICVFSLIFLVAILSCGFKNNITNDSSITNPITIDNAGIIPVVNNQRTTSVIYVHNNSNMSITGISYSSYLNTLSSDSNFIDRKSAIQCSTIAAFETCALTFTTPALSDYNTQGSVLITANYKINNQLTRFSQILSFQNFDNSNNKVKFGSGVNISGFGHNKGYATIYIYNNNYTITNLNSNKLAITFNSGTQHFLGQNTTTKSPIQAIEITSPIIETPIHAQITANLTDATPFKLTSTSNVLVEPITNKGILIAGQIPVINTALTSNPSGSLLITNAGNESITLGSSGANVPAISNLNGCTNGTKLNIGASCTIIFNVTQANGSGRITLNYTTGNTSASVNQVVNWFNSKNGALVSMNYTNPLTNLSLSTTESILVTVANVGGYNLTNVSIPAPQTLGSGKAVASISYPSSNSCQNATLNNGSSCQFILNITDATVETNQQILFSMMANYNNGSNQTYNRYSLLTYSVAASSYAYVANYYNMYSFIQDTATGSLTQMGAPLSGGTQPSGMVITPDYKHIYVANTDSGDVWAYATNSSNGVLSNIASYGIGAGPIAPVLTPNGKFLYVGTSIGRTVYAFSINSSTGALTSEGSYNLGAQVTQVVIDSTGNYLYAAASNKKIFMYLINQTTGQLTSNGSIATGNYPIAMAITPNNQFIYTANYDDNDMSIFKVNQTTGSLSLAGTSPAGANPQSLTISPNSKFLYTTGNGLSINGYIIDQSTGGLTGNGVFYTGDVDNIVITTNSLYMYVGVYSTTNIDNNYIVAYTINQSDGTLSLIGNYPTGGFAPIAYIDSINGFVYSSNLGSSNIAGYKMNLTNGSLSEVAGSPFIGDSQMLPIFMQTVTFP